MVLLDNNLLLWDVWEIILKLRLATTIGDNRVTSNTSGESVGVSGYSQGNKDYSR